MIGASQLKKGFWTFVAALILLFGLVGMAPAQKADAPVRATTAAAPAPLDYAAWDGFAVLADELISDPSTTEARLGTLRSEIADWRVKFLAAQSINSARISTIRSQIEALGPLPAEGVQEPADIAERRADLAKQLSQAQAPSIAAVEAYSRADGLIGELDGILRARQTDALLQLWPLPINPANWPDGLKALVGTGKALAEELSANWRSEEKHEALFNKLPTIIGLFLLGAYAILRGGKQIEAISLRLLEREATNVREIWSFIASLGQIIVPVLGLFALAWAVVLSGMAGSTGAAAVEGLVLFGTIAYFARWLGAWTFPRLASAPTHLNLDSDDRAKGRVLAQALGLLLGLESLRGAVMPDIELTEPAVSVLAFPTILIAGIFLFNLGKLLLRSTKLDIGEDIPTAFSVRLVDILGRLMMVAAILGPILAMAGYIRVGQALVFPMIGTLGLVGLLFTLQSLVGAVYAVLMRNDNSRDALVPVLFGFLLSFASTPLLALIWGARMSDLTEVYTKLRDGFQIGETRISPSDFVLMAVVFGFWLVVTRLLQGALRTSILPKTRLDQGGQNAIVAGIGYVGVFLAALIGITAAGMDLSGLAIVAGALSVGIGFGLQNIVSNFVAGIILLIERPISQGDWIEVNGIMGTVQGISVRSTRIQTFDRTDVIVPNSDFVSGMVTNWTRYNLTGRLIVKVRVAHGTDTRKVEKVLQEVAEAQPLAVLNPPPTVILMDFSPDCLDFEIRVILRDINFVMAVRSEINHDIVRRFAEEGIKIPFGQRDVWLRNPEVLGQMAGGTADEAATRIEPVSSISRPGKDG